MHYKIAFRVSTTEKLTWQKKTCLTNNIHAEVVKNAALCSSDSYRSSQFSRCKVKKLLWKKLEALNVNFIIKKWKTWLCSLLKQYSDCYEYIINRWGIEFYTTRVYRYLLPIRSFFISCIYYAKHVNFLQREGEQLMNIN